MCSKVQIVRRVGPLAAVSAAVNRSSCALRTSLLVARRSYHSKGTHVCLYKHAPLSYPQPSSTAVSTPSSPVGSFYGSFGVVCFPSAFSIFCDMILGPRAPPYSCTCCVIIVDEPSERTDGLMSRRTHPYDARQGTPQVRIRYILCWYITARYLISGKRTWYVACRIL